MGARKADCSARSDWSPRALQGSRASSPRCPDARAWRSLTQQPSTYHTPPTPQSSARTMNSSSPFGVSGQASRLSSLIPRVLFPGSRFDPDDWTGGSADNTAARQYAFSIGSTAIYGIIFSAVAALVGILWILWFYFKCCGCRTWTESQFDSIMRSKRKKTVAFFTLFFLVSSIV